MVAAKPCLIAAQPSSDGPDGGSHSSLDPDRAETVFARVVIVDESPECREVLHTLLESRGVSSIEVPGAREGLELIKLHHPDVIVLDLDADDADDEVVRDALDDEAREHHSALVVLGKSRRYQGVLPDGQVLSKPYHYAPLIRTIERLLAR